MTNLDEKKLDDLALEYSGYNWAQGIDLGMSARGGFKTGYRQAFADQQKKIEKLEKAVELMRTQVGGLILCLKTHGTNINDLFLIDHYKKTLAEVDAILKEGE